MAPNPTQFLQHKKYFIVIDQDEDHPNKPYFEMFLFELIKDDRFYKELNYIDQPFFQGQLQFEMDQTTEKLIPFRLLKRARDPITKEIGLKVVDADFIRLFIINAQFIVVGNHLNQPQGHELENWQIIDTQEPSKVQKSQMDRYLDQLQPVYTYIASLQYTNIRDYLFCHHCKLNKKITLIDNDTRFRSQTFYICRKCAGNEVFALLKNRIEITPQLKTYLRDLLVKYSDINKVLNVFAPNFNVLDHPEATLVNISKNEKRKPNIKPLNLMDLDLPLPLKEYYQIKKKTDLLPAQILAIEQGVLEGQDQIIISATSSGKTMIGELAGFSKILNNKIQILESNGIRDPKNLQNEHEKEQDTHIIKDLEEDEDLEDKDLSSLITSEQKNFLTHLRNTLSTKRMLYLVPIVALANMRFEEYRILKNYGINPALRIGASYLSRKDKKKSDLGSFNHADLIIGTYEAIDVLCRRGQINLLQGIATVIIDEIQMLADPERGFILDGLIARLRSFLSHAQFIYLSATVSDPQDLANHLKAALIQYEERPVAVEKHLVMCMDEGIRLKNITTLTREEFKTISSFGFKGQTIIFTNSRKNTENLSEYLRENHISAMAYHAGLTYEQRRIVERNFAKQRITCVVTTAALAAGVDFPASQVIFASVMMGIKWLTVSEFEQMVGRAGRFKKHDRGKVYLLIIPGKSNGSSQSESEEEIAIYLLKSKLEPILLEPNDNAQKAELLATIAMKTDPLKKQGINEKDLLYFHAFLYNNHYDLPTTLQYLTVTEFIKRIGKEKYYATPFGRAIAESFYLIDQALEIRERLLQPVTEEISAPNVFDIVQEFHPLNNIYVTNRALAEMTSKSQKRPTSNNFFSNAVLSLLTADNLGKKRNISHRLYEILIKWTQEIFICKCKDNPYCDCARLQIQQLLINYRLNGLTLKEIILTMADEFEIQLFYGDLIDWFEQIIYALFALQKIGRAITVPPQTMLKLKEIPQLIECLISPQKSTEDDDSLINS